MYLRPQDYTVDLARKLPVSRRDAHTDAHGLFSIDSVDTGSYCIEVNDVKSHAVLLNCTITLNDTLVKIPSDTLLYLNTSPTGADVAGTVTNFPVLVRLRANNFDFSLAKADGSDLRFSKTNSASGFYVS